MDKKSKRLIAIGVLLAFTIALPLFVWGVITQTFELREKAQEEQSPLPTSTGTAPPTACASVPMTLSITPSEQSGYPGNTKRYTVRVTNNDDANCGATHTVNLTAETPTHNGQAFSGWTVNFTPENFEVRAHDTYTTYVDVKSSTSGYAIGQYSIKVNLTNVAIPQNATSETFFYNLIGQTPTPTPTGSPIGGFSQSVGGNTYGQPNSCGGTCGSNYNCTSPLYCYGGYCRNSSCRTDVDCVCNTATPTARASGTSSPRPTSTMEIIYLSPIAKGSRAPRATTAPRFTLSPTATATALSEAAKPQSNFLLYLAGGSFALALILLIAKALRKT